MDLIVPIIQDVCTPGHLSVLAALIQGTKPDLLTPYLKSLGDLLSEDNICRNRNVKIKSFTIKILFSFRIFKICFLF